MTFLNASLLAGLLAAAIPIAVHLISRRQPRRVVFPATRFLKQQFESSRSRLRVRRLVLMALRILAIVAFALALARPQIETSMTLRWIAVALMGGFGVALLAMALMTMTGSAGNASTGNGSRDSGSRNNPGRSSGLLYGLGGAAAVLLIAALITAATAAVGGGGQIVMTDESPVALAIVIDNSIRSSRLAPATGDGGSSGGPRVIDQIRDHATWMISRYPSDSRVAIVDRSPRPASFAIDVGSANRLIDRTEPLASTRPLAERVEAAIRLVRTSDLPRRMVMVITDLTERSFSDESWRDGAIGPLLAEDPPMRLQILDVGAPAAGNRRLGPLAISDLTPPKMTPTAISTLLSVEGQASDDAADWRSVTVEVQLFDTGGQQAVGLPLIRDSQVVLPPLRSVDRTTANLSSTATRVMLSVPPLDVGTHHGVVRIVGDDELDADDRRFFTLQVRPTASVLIVAADRQSAEVIGGALNAPLAIEDPLAEYRIEISERLPAEREKYDDYELVLLVDPQTPSPAVLADLGVYLGRGGKLVSMLGPALGPATGGGVTISDATAPESFPEGLGRRWRVPQPGTFLEIVRPSHPSVAALADIAGGVPWNTFRVGQYWQLTPKAGDIVVMRYAGTDHPALIERRGGTGSGVGEEGGTHLILTTPMPALVDPARGWNELFSGTDAWPAFLLVREMVQSSIDRDKGTHNVLINDLPSIPIDDGGSASRAAVKPGDGPDDSSLVAGTRSLSGVDVPVQMFPPEGPPVPLRASGGVATIGGVERPGTYWLRGEGQTTGFSVNLLPGQTELARIDAGVLDDLIGAGHYDLVRNRDEVRQAEGRGEPTRPLYGWALLLMAGAFVLEQILANRFYRSSRAAQATGAGGGGASGRASGGASDRAGTRGAMPAAPGFLSAATGVMGGIMGGSKSIRKNDKNPISRGGARR